MACCTTLQPNTSSTNNAALTSSTNNAALTDTKLHHHKNFPGPFTHATGERLKSRLFYFYYKIFICQKIKTSYTKRTGNDNNKIQAISIAPSFSAEAFVKPGCLPQHRSLVVLIVTGATVRDLQATTGKFANKFRAGLASSVNDSNFLNNRDAVCLLAPVCVLRTDLSMCLCISFSYMNFVCVCMCL